MTQWIIPANPNRYRLEDVLRELPHVDWRQHNNVRVGDIVYIYCSSPISQIKYKMRVTSINITPEESTADREYWANPSEFDTSLLHNKFFRMVLLDKNTTQYLKLDELLLNGLKAAPQGGLKVKGPLLGYIERFFTSHKHSLKEIIENKIDFSGVDIERYEAAFAKFINEVLSKNTYSEWNSVVFNEFIAKNMNGVARLGNGGFYREHVKIIKDNWGRILPHLKLIAYSQDIPQWNEYKVVRELIYGLIDRNMAVATNRIFATIQPRILSTEVDLSKLNKLVDYIEKYTTTIVSEYDVNIWEKASYSVYKMIAGLVSEQSKKYLPAIPWKLLEWFDENYHEGKNLNDPQPRFINDLTEESSTHGIWEGALQSVLVNKYERNILARRACLTKHGYSCSVCGINFEEKYGEIGRNFIHVHHIVPISTIGQEYQIDPEKDLVPVCPNCHAMLHKGQNGNVLTVQELKELIK